MTRVKRGARGVFVGTGGMAREILVAEKRKVREGPGAIIVVAAASTAAVAIAITAATAAAAAVAIAAATTAAFCKMKKNNINKKIYNNI